MYLPPRNPSWETKPCIVRYSLEPWQVNTVVVFVAGLLGFSLGLFLIRAIKRKSRPRPWKKAEPYSRLGDHLLRDIGIDPSSTRPFSCEPPKAGSKLTGGSQ